MGWNDVPERCSSCDGICEGLQNCIPQFCIASNVSFVVVFFGLATIIFFRLYQFFAVKKTLEWSMKKLIYLFSGIFCLIRSFRYVWVLAGLQREGPAPVLFDLLAYFLNLENLFFTYSLLLAFWKNVCQRNNLSMSWFTQKIKIILIVFNGFSILLLALAALFSVILPQSFANVVINGLVAILVLALCISYIKEGTSLLRETRKFGGITNYNQAILRLVTILAIGSSIGFILIFLILIIVTLVRNMALENDSYIACQISHILYRLCEFGMISMITFTLRRHELGSSRQSAESNNSSPRHSMMYNDY